MSRERLASYYADHHARGGRVGFTFGGEDRVQCIADWVGSNSRVLDVGCRDGALTEAYAAQNQVTGVDIDEGALARAKERLGIETLWLDLNDALPFPDAAFDVVVAAEILEHVPMLTPLLHEIARVVRHGGRLVGSVPNSFRLKNRLLFLAGKPFELDPTHVRQFSPQTLRAALGAVGFGDVEIQFKSSRFLALSPRMFANDMVFRAKRV